MSSSVFNPNSPQAQAIADLFILILLIGAAILLIVTVLVLYASFRARSSLWSDFTCIWC